MDGQGVFSFTIVKGVKKDRHPIKTGLIVRILYRKKHYERAIFYYFVYENDECYTIRDKIRETCKIQ